MNRLTRDDVARIYDVPPALLPTSQCKLDGCRQDAHVVLYATGTQLAGQPTRPRQPVVFCLHHGGQIYDVIREWNDRVTKASRLFNVPRELIDTGTLRPKTTSAHCPHWLQSDLRNGRLPRTSPDPAGWAPASAAATTSRHKPGSAKPWRTPR
jgi:hypothetical protein